MWCKSAPEAISVLVEPEYRKALTEVHLDHDLEGYYYQNTSDINCGMEIVRCLEGLDPGEIKHIEFTVHTHNTWAGKQMVERIKKLGAKVYFHPFGT